MHFQVVGVAKDIKSESLFEAPKPQLYLPLDQQYISGATLLVRADRSPSSLMKSLPQEIRVLDKNLQIFGMETLDQQLYLLLSSQRSTAILIGTFGLLALLLANVGLYSVMGYSVRQRTREIGIRMALGAQQSQVLKWVLWRGTRLILLGVFCGLAAAVAATRFFASQLFGVTPTDPLTFVTVVLLLGVVGVVASWLPAHRAAKIDPMEALRYE